MVRPGLRPQGTPSNLPAGVRACVKLLHGSAKQVPPTCARTWHRHRPPGNAPAPQMAQPLPLLGRWHWPAGKSPRNVGAVTPAPPTRRVGLRLTGPGSDPQGRPLPAPGWRLFSFGENGVDGSATPTASLLVLAGGACGAPATPARGEVRPPTTGRATGKQPPKCPDWPELPGC